MSKRKETYETGAPAGRYLWPLILVLFFAGIFLLPVQLRYVLFYSRAGYYAWMNLIMTGALLILFALKRRYTLIEIILTVVWLLLLIPMFLSNIEGGVESSKMVATVVNTWLPLFLLFHRMGTDYRKKVIQAFLIIFDLIVIAFLLLAVHEKMTQGGWLADFDRWLGQKGYDSIRDMKLYVTFMHASPFRFCSLWGHALTNCAFFNGFFILNDIYFRSLGKRYPKLLFFLIALAGVLLCVGKTAIVTLLVYLVISNWRHKKWFIVYAAAVLVMYLSGFFESIINRFTTGSLTSGRVDAIIAYFGGNVYPLKTWTGYGAGTAYLKGMAPLRPAFEFPPLMYALNYGIVFSGIILGTIVFYVSWQMLSRRQIASWMGAGLFFLQMNTYNGIALCSQDMFWYTMFFLMMAINCVGMTDYLPKKEPAPVQGFKGMLIHIICCE